MPRIFVLSGNDVGRTYDFDGTAILGRAKDVDVALRSASVSRQHARVEVVDGVWTLIDLGSSNGTKVDGQRVQSVELSDGSEFTLGDLELRFRVETPEDATEKPPPRVAPPMAPPPPKPAPTSTESDLEFTSEVAETRFVPGTSPGDSDIELEGDWSESPPESVAPMPHSVRTRAPEPPAPPKAAVRVPADKAERRASALGGAAAGGLRKTHSGGRVLQYARVEQRNGLFSSDLGQQSALVRWCLYGLLVALFVGLTYGAYVLTQTFRQQSQAVEVPE